MNAPKAPLTGYVRFMNHHREAVRTEKPDIPFNEITKVLGLMWTELQQEKKQVMRYKPFFTVINLNLRLKGVCSQLYIYLEG